MNTLRRMVRGLAACSILLAMLAGSSLTAGAQEAYEPTAQFFVNDFAGVISDDAERRMVETGQALQQQTGAQIVAVTVPSLDGQSVEDYAIDLANDWGIGQESEDNGVLLLIAVEERQLRIEVGLGLEGALPDGKTGRIMDTYMVPSLREDDFSAGMLEGYLAVAAQVYAEYGIDASELAGYEALGNTAGSSAQSTITRSTLAKLSPIAVFVILVLVLGIRQRRRGFFPFFWFGGHGPHGGSGSNDDNPFGGFGGGGFGGGGGFSGGGGSFGGGGGSRGF